MSGCLTIDRTARKIVFVVSLVVATSGVVGAFEDRSEVAREWPVYRGPERNGVSQETGLIDRFPKEGPKTVWRKKLGTGYSSLTIQDGRLYSMGYRDGHDVVYGLNAETGDEIWTYSYPAAIHDVQHEGGPSSTPTVSDGLIFTLSRHAKLHCFDAITGEVKWSKDLKEEFGLKVPRWGFSSSALVDGDMVVIDVGIAAAFEKHSGNLIWKTEDYEHGYSTPMSQTWDGKKYILLFNGYGLVLVNRDDGSEVCKYEWDTQYNINATMPQVMGKQIFLSTSYGKGAGLIEFNGDHQFQSQWENTDFMTHINTAAILDGYAYGSSGHIGRDRCPLLCIDTRTGKLQWEEPSQTKVSQLFADGKLFILNESGELAIVEPSPERYVELDRAQILPEKCWTESALAGQRIYCRNDKGDVVCIDLRRE